MLNISIICVGKLKESYWREACAEYQKRLSGVCRFEIIEVEEEKVPEKASPAQIARAVDQEGKRLLKKAEGFPCFALCIEGTQLSSHQLAEKIQKMGINGMSGLALVIGGSWGLSEEVKEKAEFRLSMSPMTFPHQLARVMVCEQVYRAFQILHSGKYHK